MQAKYFYRFNDFILDDSFIKFANGSDEECIRYWNEWITHHPESREDFESARNILAAISPIEPPEIAVDKSKSLQLLLSETDRLERVNVRVRRPLDIWIRIAAIVILSSGLFFAGHIIWPDPTVFEQAAYNEIIVPVGEKSQIVLSDGTHVWINSGSSMTYPVSFNSGSRNVTLKGEAYFEVQKKNGSVFTVNTMDAEIQVLGTSFNVKAYPEDLKTQTTVVTGLVRVENKRQDIEPVIIRANQMAVIQETGPEKQENVEDALPIFAIVDNVNTSTVTSWKDHLLVFADETFEDIAVKMERWFNVDIVIENEELRKARYTGKFVHNETVYEVLEVIRLTTPIEYNTTENKITIKKSQS